MSDTDEGWASVPNPTHVCGACGLGHDGEHDCDLDPRHEEPPEPKAGT